MNNSGAKAALKGYRYQTLYTLVEILESSDADNVFQPEGEEDLAIRKNGELIRVIQVKARNEKLTLSSFNPDKKDSFFHRVSDLLSTHPGLSIEVVSFGEIGSEIEKAWAGDVNSRYSITEKLEKHGIDKERIESLFEKIQWLVVSEQDLQSRLQNHLTQTMTAGDPSSAFSLLLAWLYYAAEYKEKITKQDLINKIYAVGKYLSERAAHHQEWFKSIKPLIEEDQAHQQKNLASEFYKGVSSRFSHIQAGLDISRSEQIGKIEQAFRNGNRTVIVHGASGQGKTTLAYRYLYDFVPEDWRFQISFIDNRSHAENIALAIADHLSVFKADLYLYIDVSPRDLDWTALVKALLDKPNIKILITIREEDLARQNVSNVELGFPLGVPLHFNQSEAEKIYQNLLVKKVANPYPSFSDAWHRFGGNGALLEYVYFLTQTESLKDRLGFQVRRLQDEVRQSKLEAATLKVLFYCAVATAYESRIQLAELVKIINLSDPTGMFRLFEEEYLIRCSDDKRYVEPLHPLRSKLLVEVLNDPALNPWINAATDVLPCIMEADLESFLLYAFVEHPQEYPAIYQKLFELTLHSWQGYAGVCKALIWYGIYAYVKTNKDVIEQARLMAGNSGWKFLLRPDLTNVLDEDPTESLLEMLGKNNPEKLAKIKLLRNQVPSPDIIYQGLKTWLNNKSFELAKPENETAWFSMSETLFWLGWLKITESYDAAWLVKSNTVSEISTIVCLSELTLALYYFDKQIYHDFIRSNKSEIEKLFQKQTNTLWLEQKPENPIAHYIAPIESADEINKQNFSARLNEQTVYRVRILRNLFPEAEKFGGIGYGHHVAFMELPFDEANKPGIIKSSLPINRLVSINATYSNLADYIHRPDDWKMYAENIISTRRKIVDGLTCLNKALIAFFKNRKPSSIIGWKINEGYWEDLSRINMMSSMLPKLAVDPWGYTSEGTENNSENIQPNRPTQINASVRLAEYKNYQKAWSDYLHSVINFVTQSHLVLIVNGLIGHRPKSEHALVYQKAEELGHSCSPHHIHLTVVNLNNAKCELKNFQTEFRNRFKDLVDISALKKLEEQEAAKLEKAWHLWYQFAHHPDQYWKEAPDVRAAAITRNVQAGLINSIKKALANNPDSGWQAKLLSDTYCYEERPALWISLELKDLTSLERAYAEIVDVLISAIRPVAYKDLKYFVLTNHWQHVVIIPMIQGSTLNNLAWRILTSSFAGDEPILSDNKSWLNIPQALPEIAVNHFQFKQIKVDNFEKTQLLSKELAELYAATSHLSNYIEISKKLNNVGSDILQDYLSKFHKKLAENISTADSIITDLKTGMENDDDLKLEALRLCENAIYPYGKPDDDQIIVNLNDCKEWSILINEAISMLQVAEWTCSFTLSS
ncbi:P-loop NTPase family protein [Methylobacter luteus]|uniref:ATP-binding protein n=1 Tax=Methylobacter luteus TaxID=415 RepID=UPI0004251B37|nr:ATP-binding protein [Methylobacter luteus]